MPNAHFPPVLVVDDVGSIVDVVRAVLGQLGFHDVDAAGDGSAAFVRMQTRRYGLVISDWNMDSVTGYASLRRVRSDRDLRETPVVMMTTEAQAHCFAAARRAGVNACLVEPFTLSRLRETIIAVCGPMRTSSAG